MLAASHIDLDTGIAFRTNTVIAFSCSVQWFHGSKPHGFWGVFPCGADHVAGDGDSGRGEAASPLTVTQE
jgi:hypothetical protein